MAEKAGRHAAPEPKPDPRSRVVKNRRPGAKHVGTSAHPTSPARPVRGPAPTPRPTLRGGSGTGMGPRGHTVAHEAHNYAQRQAFRATNARPSVVGRGVSGAAAGAASGAAIGSIVPGVGTAVGAGTGAVLGGAGGAVSGARAKRAYDRALQTNGHARLIIVVEFAVCIVIAALSPLTEERRDEPPASWMKRMTAIMGVFFVLGLISAGGRGAARAAAGFGGVITVALALSNRDLFARIAKVFASTDDQPAAGTGPHVDPTGTTGERAFQERAGR